MPSFENDCKERGLFLCQGGMQALGAIIGSDSEVKKRWVLDKFRSVHTPFFDSLKHPDMPAQHMFTFLRLCMLPRMNFWTRVLPPFIVNQATKEFDKLVEDTVIHKLQLPSLEDEARKIFRLPIRLEDSGCDLWSKCLLLLGSVH